MSDKKLTPRVGDRVLVVDGGRTKVGNIHAFSGKGKYAHIDIDGWGVAGGFLTSGLTVVDREPVEWPDGWSKYSGTSDAVIHDTSAWAIDRNTLRQILATGPEMLARWDELMDGEE